MSKVKATLERDVVLLDESLQRLKAVGPDLFFDLTDHYQFKVATRLMECATELEKAVWLVESRG